MASRARTALSLLATAGTMLALDALWIGVIAKPAYDALGSLKRDKPFLPAAGLFYGMYAMATYVYAIKPAATAGEAAKRAAGLGLVAYATYELTNAAIIRDWPAILVPVDTGWGIALSAASAAVGHVVRGRRHEG
jgi:uncharacterized membrane protein